MFIHARYTFYVVLSVILLKTVETNAQMHENCSVWWVRDFAEQKCISQLQKLIETSSLGFKLPNWPSQWICIETVKFHIWRGCHLTGVKNLPSDLVSILPHLSSMLQCFYVAPPKVSIWQEMEPKIIANSGPMASFLYREFVIMEDVVCYPGSCNCRSCFVLCMWPSNTVPSANIGKSKWNWLFLQIGCHRVPMLNHQPP